MSSSSLALEYSNDSRREARGVGDFRGGGEEKTKSPTTQFPKTIIITPTTNLTIGERYGAH